MSYEKENLLTTIPVVHYTFQLYTSSSLFALHCQLSQTQPPRLSLFILAPQAYSCLVISEHPCTAYLTPTDQC